ncbi:MAG TPA: 1,4-dihydroxy-2-naphthoate polyprenyltransferase [Myxococcaceae bacterium]|nr:1,4-dihydroxy-2-naphthoate polyprenyltransferase [Myxococcaceae bacterium]
MTAAAPVASPSLRTWLLAARPKTLTAAVVPVVVGTGLALGLGLAAVWPALAALAGAVLIQIGTNLTNDYYDFRKGADTHERLGPTRVTQSGLIAPQTVLAAGAACFALAVVVGIFLVARGGWPFVVIGLASVLAGWAYTGGPYPLGYHGLGDLFVMVFFGLVAVPGTFYAQALRLVPAVWPAAVAIGATGTMILVVNNLRDLDTDARAGKRTLVVRFGRGFGRAEYVTLLLLALAMPVVIVAMSWSRWPVLLALCALPLAWSPLSRVLRTTGAALNPALGTTARFQAAFGFLLAIGAWLGNP